MTDEKVRPTYLRAVTRSAPRPSLPNDSFTASGWQRTLFVTHNENLLAFVDFSKILEAEFLEVVVGSRAQFVIDLRLVPRFDTGTLNRKMVFALFSQTATKYIDMSGELGLRDKRDANLNPGLLVEHLLNSLKRSDKPLTGPIVFLVDAAQFTEEYVTDLANEMQSLKSTGWEILRVPVLVEPSTSQGSRRNLIFISHANPEDNDFTKWLGLQLSLSGYQVWSDVTKLLGGEQIWISIEDAIRNYAAKVITVLSTTAQSKAGVLDEINCAISVERAGGLEGFVIPIRIDQLPFSDVRANLARKNIIDFHANWAKGLEQLLATLQRDGAPRAAPEYVNALADWCRKHARSTAHVQNVPETLYSNWLKIEKLPPSLHFRKFHEDIVDLAGIKPATASIPHFKHKDFVVSLWDQRASIEIESNGDEWALSIEDALKGGTEKNIGLDATTASRQIMNLLRQTWDAYAQGKGLLPYQIASGAIAWYPPTQLLKDNWATFKDSNGKARRKYLVGRSEKRKVFWHYAVELRPVIARLNRFVMVPHIVFTEDGHSTLIGKEKMHSLRRGFCKNWWNDRWRDLSFGFLSWLSEGQRHISFSASNSAAIIISSSPLTFRAPISINLPSTSHFDDLLRDVEWEDLDVVADENGDGYSSDLIDSETDTGEAADDV